MLDASTLDEVHIEIGNFKLDVRRRTAGEPMRPNLPAVKTEPADTAQFAARVPPAPASRYSVELAPGQFPILAPMLGIFYRASAPGAPPFVELGSKVVPGDTVCIIEVMKLMSTIKAERAGCVAAVLIEDATMVEFGQPLIVFDSP